MKICTKCKLEKVESEFSFDKYNSDGLRFVCKKCMNEYSRIYKQSDKYKEYLQSDKCRKSHRKYIECNSKKRKIYMKEYQKKYQNEYQKKYLCDIQHKIASSLRSRLWNVLSGRVKVGSAVRDLGCSIIELKIYLESKFKSGMTWENYGKWHIDHIYPLSKVDLTDREQLLRVCHYTNLQPLWAEENLRKHNKIY